MTLKNTDYTHEYLKLSIIIVNYNTREMVLECLRSILFETENVSFEVIVLDNASTDASYEAIAQNFGNNDKIRLIPSPRNLGFAAGNNYAATDAKGEFLLLLNPDTVILNRAIERLISFAELHPDAGIWGGRTIFADYSLNPASCWSKQTFWSLLSQALGLSSVFRQSNIFNPEGIGGWNRQGDREVDIVSGCFLLIRYELWNQLNGFNPEFFMYGEEADLCLRARSLGARPVVTSAATIVHYGGASEKVHTDKMVRLLKAKNLLIRHHFHPTIARISGLLITTWPLTRWIAHTILTLVNKHGSRESAEIWREIWKRRNEWMYDKLCC